MTAKRPSVRESLVRFAQCSKATLDLAAVRDELATVDALIEYLLSCLEDQHREHVEYAVNRHELGYNEQAGKTGVLFPEWLVEAHLGPPMSDRETDQANAESSKTPPSGPT